MSDHPLISVIIPVYNAELYLEQAIETVLMQSVHPLEIIVINDGSTDASGTVANRYKELIIYEEQDNLGAAAARNHGVRLATGPLLSFLDADDLWTKNKLALQYEVMRTTPELDMVFGLAEQFISPELADTESSPGLREELKKMPGYLMGALLIRKTSFHTVGYLQEDLQLGEFVDWFEKAKAAGLSYKMLDDIVLRRRIHKTNQGVTKRDHRKDYLKVLKANLERKRALKEQ